jgi:hypothetical protein
LIILYELRASIRNRDRAVLHLAVPCAILYLPYFAWRYSYYGYLLPNTFYAKVGFSIDQVIRGAQYALQFAGPAFLILVPLVWCVFFSRQWFRSHGGVRLPLYVIAAYVLYVVLVGGDSMPAFRFFAPIIPLLCLLSAMSARLATSRGKVIVLLVVVTAFYNIAQMRIAAQIHDHLMADRVAHHGKEVGLWLRANVPADALVATNTAGTIPYFSGLRTIDMMGMNDVHIAHREIPQFGRGRPGHEKGDGAYVLSRRPDYIIFNGGLGSQYPYMPGDKEIYANPGFRELYSLRVQRLASGCDLRIYERIGAGESP